MPEVYKSISERNDRDFFSYPRKWIYQLGIPPTRTNSLKNGLGIRCQPKDISKKKFKVPIGLVLP